MQESGSVCRREVSGVDGSGACDQSVQEHCDMCTDVARSTEDVMVTRLVWQKHDWYPAPGVKGARLRVRLGKLLSNMDVG